MLVELQAGLCTCAAANTHSYTQHRYTFPAKNEHQETKNNDSDSSACIQRVGSSAQTAFGTEVQKMLPMSSLCNCDTALAQIKA